MKTQVMIHKQEFHLLRYYFRTLNRLLYEPRRFFDDLPIDIGWKRPLCFLLISSLFFAAAGVIGSMSSKPLLMGGIFFTNAVGMTLISAAIGFSVVSMSLGKRAPFELFFSIYAFASGVTLLSSWIPFFVVLTEPWKWWLIYTGLKKMCGLSGVQCGVIVAVSITIQTLFFWTVLPFIAS